MSDEPTCHPLPVIWQDARNELMALLRDLTLCVTQGGALAGFLCLCGMQLAVAAGIAFTISTHRTIRPETDAYLKNTLDHVHCHATKKISKR